MTSILCKLSEIKPAKYNPRRISESAFTGLVESIKKFGMPQPLVVNKRSGVLVSGHQRLRAAESLGWTEVPVIYVDLEPAAEKALNVTLNNRATQGDFTEALNVVIDDIERALGGDFLKQLCLDGVKVPEVNFDEPEEKKEPEEREADMATCPNCGVVI